MLHKQTAVAGLLVLALAGPAVAEDGAALVQAQCAGCHALAPQDNASVEDRMSRKGPPLFYAADKYRADWMVAWLQDPARIHPAGVFFGNHLKAGPEGDEIDEATLAVHPVLSAGAALAVTEHLMTLSAKADLLAVDYTPGKVSKRMGMLNFGKFKGCSSCHSDEAGYGGASGPELHTAWHRLRPDYIVSYILNPQAWEPVSLMPNQHLNPADAGKLADYLKVIAEDSP